MTNEHPGRIGVVLEEVYRALQSDLPNATGVLCRKSLELFTKAKGRRKQDWEVRLQALYEAGIIGRHQFGVGHYVRRVGNRAAHKVRGILNVEARRCWELTKLFLQSAGVELNPSYGPVLSLQEIRAEYGEIDFDLPWSPPLPFEREWQFPIWYGGGIIDVLFRCRTCGSEIEVEDVEVSPPYMLADSHGDSRVYASSFWDCETCGSSYEIATDNSLGGWDLEINMLLKGSSKGRQRRPQGKFTPKVDEFRFRTVIDFEEIVEDVDSGEETAYE